METGVIVVGGAVAGAALANALGSKGVPTLMLEKVSREVHSTRGDLLHPPTLRLLDRWGVLAALHEDGALQITDLAVSTRADGPIARFPIPASGEGQAGRTIAVPHDRIEQVLYDCAERWSSVQSERGTVSGLLRDAGGRVAGVRFRRHGSADDVEIRGRVVAGCDGSQSLVRRELGIGCEQHPYDHEQIIIGGRGMTDPPASLHWYLDDVGRLCVVSRPRQQFRILLTLPLGERGDLLKKPDPALHEYVAGRFPSLEPLEFAKQDAHLYRLARHLSDAFWKPGAVLVGDSAHATHPAGASGMSLAITGASRLADYLAPLLMTGRAESALDDALEAYDAERRPAATLAVESNHEQALRIWQSDLYKDPAGYARAIDPSGSWGAGGAGWGQDPAALSLSGSPTGGHS